LGRAIPRRLDGGGKLTVVDQAGTDFDDHAAVAAAAAALPRPLIVGLDVDGVLAPIVNHASDAQLLPGVLDAVRELAWLTPVAVVSGRTVEDLARFGFPDHVQVFGTHGLERRDEPVALEEQERRRYERLARLAADAADRAGDGAWVEVKPAGVVLHVREAPPETSAASVAELHRQAADVTGAHVLPGHGVVELLARATSKANAIAALRRELGGGGVVFVGDDRTDEEVFEMLARDNGGCSIRVGDGPTAAAYRLAGPPEVLQFLRQLLRDLRRERVT
jgi:trehalose 6-phosphate phosphatase